ncbi:MAG: PEP-CTERM sorting domain-containing protein [Pirellulales bacterium]|nr:PEP-CTERM sorting domain-containing protein [Pirellulales bacterium]
MKTLVVTASVIGACVPFLADVNAAGAVDYTWAGPVSGDWADVAKWNPTGVPGGDPADTASITATGAAYTVNGMGSLSAFTLDSPDATVLLATTRIIPVNGPYRFENGSVTCRSYINWSGSGTLTNNAQMTILDHVNVSCPFVQNGHLLIQGGPVNDAHISSGNFINAGTITLDSTDPAFGSRLSAGDLTNAGTIHSAAGAGGARDINALVTNEGQILIDADTVLTPTAGDHVNRSFTRVAAGKTLTVMGASKHYGPVFNQDAGTLQIDGELVLSNSATFNYNGGTILGPVVLADTFMEMTLLHPNHLNIAAGATDPAEFVLRSSCALGGDLHAGQTITLDIPVPIQGMSACTLYAAGSTNFGTIALAGHGGVLSCGTRPGDTLTNAGILNINATRSPQIGTYIEGRLTNNGEVNISSPVAFIEPLGGAPSRPFGAVNNGHLRLLNTTMTFNMGCKLTNGPEGTLSGGGTIDVRHALGQKLTNEGVLAPGLSVGTLTIDGLGVTFHQTDSGVLEIEIGEAGHDVLAITGGASLAGLLDVQLQDGFVPRPGDAFDVLTTTLGFMDNSLVLSPEDRGLWTMQYVDEGKTLRLVCVPEPATWALLALGAAAMAAVRRRRATT